MGRFERKDALVVQLREAQHRLEMLDASIRAHQDAGEWSTAARLMRARPSFARQVEAAAERVREAEQQRPRSS